jgi:hypothetical protein
MSNFKVLSIQDLPLLRSFEDAKHQHLNEIEKMTLSWKAPWREESLEFYIKAGWCIGNWDSNEKFSGYFLAQPILFMESYTQTLWIEYVSYTTLDTFSQLVEFAYKYGRDKHLQRVLFNTDVGFDKITLPFKTSKTSHNFIEVYTTKMS